MLFIDFTTLDELHETSVPQGVLGFADVYSVLTAQLRLDTFTPMEYVRSASSLQPESEWRRDSRISSMNGSRSKGIFIGMTNRFSLD